MVRVPSPVTPLEGLVGGHVYILEVIVSSVAPISPWSRDGKASRDWAIWEGKGITGD